jgi:small subunit ribosomal protein S17
MSDQTSSGRRTKVGVVISDKMDKTVVVAVEHLRRHRLYGRHVRRTRQFKAHDEENRCRIGDQVLIEESRPISRDKRWRVRDILHSAGGPPIEIVDEPEVVAS